MSYVYFISETGDGPIKIGRGGEPDARLAALQVGNARRLEIIGVIEDRDDLEGDLHDQFRRSRLMGEWFARTPELLAYIADHAESWADVDPRRVTIVIPPALPPAISPTALEMVTAIGERMRHLRFLEDVA